MMNTLRFAAAAPAVKFGAIADDVELKPGQVIVDDKTGQKLLIITQKRRSEIVSQGPGKNYALLTEEIPGHKAVVTFNAEGIPTNIASGMGDDIIRRDYSLQEGKSVWDGNGRFNFEA